MTQEMPTFMATTYGDPSVFSKRVSSGGQQNYWGGAPNEDMIRRFVEQAQEHKRPRSTFPSLADHETAEKEDEPMSDRRLVRVLVVDPHEDVPTDSALLYDSKEVFTDKTDQELYFDVPMAKLLKEHNEKRTKVVDKSVKDRTEHLEPARIRDLKLLVITLAEF